MVVVVVVVVVGLLQCSLLVIRFQTDFWICGLAPFGEYLVVLAYVDEADSDEDDGSTPSAPV